MSAQVSRPPLRYFGGKFADGPKIVAMFPVHRVFVDLFGGGGSITLVKPRSEVEVYNDLDGQVVTFFRVLRDPDMADRLIRAVTLTPYSRAEFDLTWSPLPDDTDPVEVARRLVFRSAAGHGSVAATGKWRTGFRSNITRAYTRPVDDWLGLPEIIAQAARRFRGVIVESLDALDCIDRYDTPDTLFYADPPYMWDTRHERWAGKSYRHEMTDDDHARLADALRSVKGAVVLSHYDHPLYREWYRDWPAVSFATTNGRGNARTEYVWIKPGRAVQPSLV